MSNVVSRINKMRNKRECLFKDIGENCKSNGTHICEKNHIIASSGYLEPISEKNKVMIFAWEEQEYYKNGGKLSKRNIIKANRYRVLCGQHDRLLFSEIENGKKFEEGNAKLYFQFFLRSFLFQHAESEVKQNFNLVNNTFEKVAALNLQLGNSILQKLKNIYTSRNWNDIETRVIILKNYKAHFVSSFYGKPICDTSTPLISRGQLSINVLQKDDDVVVLLSWMKDSSKSIKKYCENLCHYAKNKEEQFVKYISKLCVSSDANIAINPVFWNNLSANEQESFYRCANYFRKNDGFFKPLIKWLAFSREAFNFSLMSKI